MSRTGPKIERLSVLPHMRQSWETMTAVSAGHIILTPTPETVILGPIVFVVAAALISSLASVLVKCVATLAAAAV